jgi:hypothetical protein
MKRQSLLHKNIQITTCRLEINKFMQTNNRIIKSATRYKTMIGVPLCAQSFIPYYLASCNKIIADQGYTSGNLRVSVDYVHSRCNEVGVGVWLPVGGN